MVFDLTGYAQHGITTPLRVLPESEARSLNDQVMAIRSSPAPDVQLGLETNPHMLFPWLYDLATRTSVLDAVEQILGPDLLIWSSQFFAKEPGDGGFVSWHQDSTYWGLEPNTVTTAWIALAPSTKESGCMQVVPGSHDKGQFAHKDTFDEDNLLSRGQEVEVDVAGMETLDVVLQPGEMSLHHVQLVHGSEPNNATWPRVGFVVRYIPTSVRQIGGRTRANLVRGEDRFGHFELTAPPTGELTAQGWADVNDAKARLTAIVMQSATQASQHANHRVETPAGEQD